MVERSASDLARETLRQLALKKLPPTPENYAQLYESAAGKMNPPRFPHGALRCIHALLPAQTSTQKRLRDQLGDAVELRDWHSLQQAMVAYAHAAMRAPEILALPSTEQGSSPIPARALPLPLVDQLQRRFELLQPLLEELDPLALQLHAQLGQVLHAVPVKAASLANCLHDQHYQLSLLVADQGQVRRSLLALVHALIEHLALDSQGDKWLAPQFASLKKAVAPPLRPAQLEQAQHALQALLLRRSQLQQGVDDAQQALKTLLAGFVQRLAEITSSHEALDNQMERAARRLAHMHKPEDAAPLLQQLLESTHNLARNSHTAHLELQDLRQQTEAREAQIQELQQELDSAELRTRRDELTGQLNHQGLGEVLSAEVARAKRHHRPLSLAMLDMDEVLTLSDGNGNNIGAAALAHMIHLVRRNLRPEDSIGRHDEQTFVLLFPETNEPSALIALQRLQRVLDSTPMHLGSSDTALLHLNLSAGIVQLQSSDSTGELLRRAQATMLRAKLRSGRCIACSSGAQWPHEEMPK
ncbi:GGDEF domain-containing protein [Comamonas composti]|uniref:GGDEF domain-containing protein n=1 Tax=Comamonas composti TaxID=408558 RepID=UPI00042A382B|nr:GGDEF domain-containing protein [Comamonas composti]